MNTSDRIIDYFKRFKICTYVIYTGGTNEWYMTKKVAEPVIEPTKIQKNTPSLFY